jgi:hypothetical protein
VAAERIDEPSSHALVLCKKSRPGFLGNCGTKRSERLGEVSGSHGDEYEDGCLLGCCDKFMALMMEAVTISQTSVDFVQTSCRNITQHNQCHVSSYSLQNKGVAAGLKP